MKYISSFFISLLLFTSSHLIACSCKPLSKINDEEISKAKDIFIGKVLTVEEVDGSIQKIVFQVIERLKTTDSTQVEVINGWSAGVCGLNVKPGQEWYIFTSEYADKSWVTLCGRNALLSSPSYSENEFSNRQLRRYMRQYNKAKSRAKKEIRYIKKRLL